jgi:hypothetical protein
MNNQADQNWFEMRDVWKPRLATATWVPLFTSKVNSNSHRYAEDGFLEEYFIAVAIIFPVSCRENALKLPWEKVMRNPDNRPYVAKGIYYSGDTFVDRDLEMTGTYSVLEQSFDGVERRKLHLHQDVILGLGLLREEDKWTRPAEDYLEVARLERNADKKAEAVLIKAEHLRDYLAARSCGLLVATFRSRRGTFAQSPNFNWDGNKREEDIAGGRWEGSITEIDETGSPYGSEVAVFRVWRTDVDYEDEVPVFSSPDDRNVGGTSKTFRRGGQQLFLVLADMWRNEWIDPGPCSPRVRGDRIEPAVPFIIDNTGKTAVAKQLIGESRWLWFHPRVVTEILKRRGAKIVWYSENTGGLRLPCHSLVHFGVNPVGLINVFAKDVGLLPEFVQKIWAGHNVSPNGPVSPELLSVQMECRPVGTKAPEILLTQTLDKLQLLSKECFGEYIFREHPMESKFLVNIHRFHSVDLQGACQLCKEIYRLVIERLNIALLKRLTPTADDKLGSIKRLEKILDQYGKNGKEIAKALVGIYELRHADAHLPSGDLRHALDLLGVEMQSNFIDQGKTIIRAAAMTIEKIAETIRRGIS